MEAIQTTDARRMVAVLALSLMSNVAIAGEERQEREAVPEKPGEVTASLSTSVTRYGPAYGGQSGTYYQVNCAPGSVAVGIHGGSANLIDRVALICAPVLGNGVLGEHYVAGVAGGDGGNSFWLTCASGFAIESIYGRYGALIDRLGIRCRSLNWANSYIGPSTGGAGGIEFWDAVGYGEFVTGIAGRTEQNAESYGTPMGVNGIVSGIAARYSAISW